ncbi:nitrile hydratase activator like P-loop ATPase [Cryptosporidium ubiquitum]|uniref:Nitrile hydratase activator like P-loop ATPase n=1 Tax=Cryptosporidium ubiquitum TaxID=857276 RepID=A0A1J4MEB2_9CRYT|nr:nitrile hydratase activator like P-loop ATPase [Cryptosporidium ubiquitum]OII72578.1 nitrile hydratase activator like P-loop ATPase [Cryptosporidium ubiquitum]
MSKVPIYIVTGFLGSGKTTLLRHIISSYDQDIKIAIIQNDFSDEMGIEAPTMQDKDGNLFKEFFELPNGCVCCTVKDELLKAIEHLLSMRKFEKILLETTGVADPEPIIEKFWLDCELESSVELSGVITVIDTFNFKNYLDLGLINQKVRCNPNNNLVENDSQQRNSDLSHNNTPQKLLSPEIIKQIMLANKIVLNKTDLIENKSEGSLDNLQALAEIQAIVRAINPIAHLVTAIKSQVKMEWLFDLDAFNIHKIIHEIDRAFNNSLISSHSNNSLLKNISSYTISFNNNTLFDLKSLERAIAKVAWEEEEDNENKGHMEERNQEPLKYDSVNSKYGKLIRFKGIFKAQNSINSNYQSDSTGIYALQGVGQIFEILPIKINENLENSKFFFLGIKLDSNNLNTLLTSCIIK